MDLTLESRRQIVHQIRARDSLFKKRGHVSFNYSSKKLIDFGNSKSRIILNFELQQISFLDKDGLQFEDSIECVLGIVQIIDTPGALSVYYRSQNSPENAELKEKVWIFKPPEDAILFQRFVNLMLSNGTKIRRLFDAMNFRNKRSIERDDLEIIINAEKEYFPVLEKANVAMMISECDVEKKGKTDATYSDLFALMSTSSSSCVETMGAFLTEWMKLSTQRAEVKYSPLEKFPDMNDDLFTLTPESPPALPVTHPSLFRRPDKVDWLDGEKELSKTNKVVFTMADPTVCETVSGALGRGDCSLTNFRLVLFDLTGPVDPYSDFRYDAPPYPSQISLPLSSIARLELEQDYPLFDLVLMCKDLRIIRIGFTGGKQFATQFMGVLQMYAFPADPKSLFAFTRFTQALVPRAVGSAAAAVAADSTRTRSSSVKAPAPSSSSSSASSSNGGTEGIPSSLALSTVNGWAIFSPVAEYTRLGILRTDSRWRLWEDNFNLVPTYPSGFIVPAVLTDAEVIEAAKFRSRCRLPALTWQSPLTGAVLCRSSQPNVGFSNKTNLCDKLLLNLYRMKGHRGDDLERTHPTTFYIIDCRSKLAANANAVMGKGVENMKTLVETCVLFCGIGNIHTMRASLENLHRLLYPFIPKGKGGVSQSISALLNRRTQLQDEQARLSESKVVLTDPDEAFAENMEYAKMLYTRVEESGWLDHTRNVISSSVLVAETLNVQRCGVLVHCSDGWDRTAQVSATAQIILDPYYRTLEGLFVLIEKEWCGFGHKFQDRLGQSRPSNGDEGKEISPVFIQWLDVMSQIVFQFPFACEFNEELLVFIADAAHSCMFGTFLGNSEKERKITLGVEQSTQSLWSYVLHPSNVMKFKNPNYQPTTVHIWPASSRVRLWERYFCRWEPADNPRVGSGLQWRDLWV